MSSPHWRRDAPQWYNVHSLDWTAVGGPRLTHGVEGRLISRAEEKGESATFMMRVPLGWRHTEPADEGTLEVLIVDGTLDIEGQRLGPGGFIAVSPGCGSVEFHTPTGCAFQMTRAERCTAGLRECYAWC